MTRGRARGLTDPADDMLHGWAHSAVEFRWWHSTAVSRGVRQSRAPRGMHAGAVGRMEGALFERAVGDQLDLAPQSPARYGVNLRTSRGLDSNWLPLSTSR